MEEYAIKYATSVSEERITVEAESINDALIYFAKNYKDFERVHSVEKIESLYNRR